MSSGSASSTEHDGWSRREFLRGSALGLFGASLAAPTSAACAAETRGCLEVAELTDSPLFSRPGVRSAAVRIRPETALIWFPDGKSYFETGRNEWCCFRKSVALREQPASLRLLIFADARYRLWFNGHYVARGPSRCDPRWQQFDVLDLAAWSRAGDNLLAVQVLYHGYGTGQHLPRVPALLAELVAGDEEELLARTDGSWRCWRSEAFDPHAPRVNGCQGAIEVFDARVDPPNWMSPGFDDRAWPTAKARALGAWNHPYYRLLPRDIPLLHEEVRAPQRWTEPVRVRAADDEPFLPARLQRELERLDSITAYAAVSADGLSFAATPGNELSLVTVDFGQIEAGYLRLRVEGPAGSIIDVVYAEVLVDGKTLFNPAAQRPIERFILREGANDLEVAFAWKGFRYVQLFIRNPAGALQLRAVEVRTRRYPLKETGYVRALDPWWQQLWEMCARTLRLCLQDAFVDSPSREQQQWMGDARWQAIYMYYLSGDDRLHRRLLHQIGQSQDADGLTKSRYPDGHESWQPIPSYCLAWITSFADHHRLTGDLDLIRERWPNVLLALRWFTAFENDQGLLEDVPHWSYVDMGAAPAGKKLDTWRGGVVTPLNLLYVEALNSAAHLAGALGERTSRQALEDRARRVSAAVKDHLWDETRGVYPDCRVKGQFSPTVSEPTLALALLHLEQPEREAALLKWFGMEPPASVVPASPLFLPVVIRALHRHGEKARLVDMLKNRYQPLMDAGSGTTWEYWELFHRNSAGQLMVASASHAWGAGALIWFFEVLLGLEVLEPGFRRFALAPSVEPIGTCEFAVPTRFGLIEGRFALVAGRRQLEWVVPPGTMSVVGGREFGPGRHRVTTI